MTGVGPLSLIEHVLWFLVLSLVLFLTYNSLRIDSVSVAARNGVRRWLYFVVGVTLLGAASHLLEEFL